MCHQVTPTHRDPMNDRSPKCPVLISPVMLLPVASFRKSIHFTFGLFIFLLPFTFPSIIFFPQRILSSREVSKQGSLNFNMFACEVMCAWFDLGATCSFFRQSRVSTKPFPSTIFPTNISFVCVTFLYCVQLSHPCKVIRNTTVRIILVLVSSNISLC